MIKKIDPKRYPANLSEDEKTALTKWIGFDQIQTLEVNDTDFMQQLNFTGYRNFD